MEAELHVFCECGSEVNGYSCWHCLCASTGKRSIAVTSWVEAGGEIHCVCFFSSTPKSPPICWLGGKEDVHVCVFEYEHLCVCVGVCTCSSVHMDAYTCVGLFLCYVPMHLWVSYTNIQIRKCSTGNSELKTDQNKSCFLIFSGQCVYVCIHYISRWERTNIAEQRARSLQKGKQQNHLTCSLQEGSGWKEWKNTSHIQCMWKQANTCIDHKHIHVHIHTHSFGEPFNSN